MLMRKIRHGVSDRQIFPHEFARYVSPQRIHQHPRPAGVPVHKIHNVQDSAVNNYPALAVQHLKTVNHVGGGRHEEAR